MSCLWVHGAWRRGHGDGSGRSGCCMCTCEHSCLSLMLWMSALADRKKRVLGGCEWVEARALRMEALRWWRLLNENTEQKQTCPRGNLRENQTAQIHNSVCSVLRLNSWLCRSAHRQKTEELRKDESCTRTALDDRLMRRPHVSRPLDDNVQ